MTRRLKPAPTFHSYLTLSARAILAVLLLASAHAQDLTPSAYISFDAPNAGTASGQGTSPAAINRHGWIGGTVRDSAYVPHGFLRSRDGVFITIDPPTSVQTFVSAINAYNEVVGHFYSATASHGFVRDAGGNYKLLDVPGATSTTPSGINDTAVVVGVANDASGAHGFLWDAQHRYTVFDVPGAKSGTTYPVGINQNGVVTGFYFDTDNDSHGFVRNQAGSFTTFVADVNGTQTQSAAINASGQITGWTNDGLGDTYGFLRNAEGGLGLFGVSGSPGNTATDINDHGVIVGYIFSDAGGEASFERDQAGNITVISLPFSNTNNVPVGINLYGQITGFYTDPTGVNHGWEGVQ